MDLGGGGGGWAVSYNVKKIDLGRNRFQCSFKENQSWGKKKEMGGLIRELIGELIRH